MFPRLLPLLPLLLAVMGVAACVAEASVAFLEQRDPGLAGDADALDKRAASALGFSGLRGKKSEFEDGDDNVDKRAGNGLGFSGLRGKKDDVLYDVDYASVDKRARNTLGFSGMRGKKDGGDLNDGDADSSVFDKRARNSLGFSGLRGKKDSGEMVMEDLVEKRGNGRNTLGFSGMRGKKDGSDTSDAADAAFEVVDAIKRARTAAFVGMRGRRENKQAFFGMRGKRGERGDAEAEAEDDAVFGYLQSPDAARGRIVTFRSKRYLPAQWQLRNSKKAPFSGFIGLRGKKSFIPSRFQESQEMVQ